jgi:hypothetical protein
MIPRTARLMNWQGPLPEIGEYLKTPRGSVYLVIGVKPSKKPGAKLIATLDLLWLAPDDVYALPLDTTFHEFKWGFW